MSLWFRRKAKSGDQYWYSVSVPALPVFAFVGMLVALMMPLVAALRTWLAGN